MFPSLTLQRAVKVAVIATLIATIALRVQRTRRPPGPDVSLAPLAAAFAFLALFVRSLDRFTHRVRQLAHAASVTASAGAAPGTGGPYVA